MSSYNYYTTYVDAHGLGIRVYNGGENMFPSEFIDGCVTAHNERHVIFLLGREINKLKRVFKNEHGVEFIPQFSLELQRANYDHRSLKSGMKYARFAGRITKNTALNMTKARPRSLRLFASYK
ncbi:hypothetical protein TKK_0016623 [Trichogramma kaykai]